MHFIQAITRCAHSFLSAVPHRVLPRLRSSRTPVLPNVSQYTGSRRCSFVFRRARTHSPYAYQVRKQIITHKAKADYISARIHLNKSFVRGQAWRGDGIQRTNPKKKSHRVFFTNTSPMHKSKHDEDVKCTERKKKYVTPEKYEKICGTQTRGPKVKKSLLFWIWGRVNDLEKFERKSRIVHEGSLIFLGG